MTHEEREMYSNFVALDCKDLVSLVSRIFAWRLNPETADLVAIEEGNLLAARGTLDLMVDEIRQKRDGQRNAA